MSNTGSGSTGNNGGGGAAPPGGNARGATPATAGSRSMGSARPPGVGGPSTSASSVSMGSARPPTAGGASSASASAGAARAGTPSAPAASAGRYAFKPTMNVRRARPASGSASPGPSTGSTATTSTGTGSTQSGSSASRDGRSTPSFGARGAGAFARGGTAAGSGGRGRGRGRMQDQIPLTASGPFSMGPGGLPRGKASSASRLGMAGSSSSSALQDGGIAPGSALASSSSTSTKSTSGQASGQTARSIKLDPARFRDARKDLEYAEDDELSDDEGQGIRRDARMSANDLEKFDEYAPRSLPKFKFDRNKRRDGKVGGSKKKREEGGQSNGLDKDGLPFKAKDEPVEEDAMDVDSNAPAPAAKAKAPATLSSDKAARVEDANEVEGLDGDDDDDQEAKGRTADALDLSESEDEELMDDLLSYFIPIDGSDPEEKLYLFQFPTPFPNFFVPASQKKGVLKKDGDGGALDDDDDVKMEGDVEDGKKSSIKRRPSGKGVFFTPDTTGGAGAAGVTPSPNSTPAPEARLKAKKEEGGSDEDVKPSKDGNGKRKVPEGRIGSLNLYSDGRIAFHLGSPDAARRTAVANAQRRARQRAEEQDVTRPPTAQATAAQQKARLSEEDNMVILDVTGGSPATFLQQLMLLNPQQASATCLGEIERKFVVTPDLDSVLEDLELRDM